MTEARYDAVADFYEAGWPDAYDDSVSTALLDRSTGSTSWTWRVVTGGSPPAEWEHSTPDAARHPVFLVAACRARSGAA